MEVLPSTNLSNWFT